MVRKVSVLAAVGIMLLLGMTYFARGAQRVASVSSGPEVGGKIVYARSGSLWTYDGGNQHQLTRGPQDKADKRDAQPVFSPDGSQVIYVRFDEGFSDLYRLRVASPAAPIALTEHRPTVQTGAKDYNTQALWAMQPAWSPDGGHIAYTSDVGTEYPGLFTMTPEGDGPRRVTNLDFSRQAVEHPSWSPDSNKIAVADYIPTATSNGNGVILVFDLTTGKRTELTDGKNTAYDPSWSPDGEWIAFAMRVGNVTNIYAVPTDAQKWTGDYPTPVQLTKDGASRSPAWSPDGGKLAYISLKGTSFDMYVSTVQTSTTGQLLLSSAQKLTDNANIDATSGLSWSR